jgi:hypothetical protein
VISSLVIDCRRYGRASALVLFVLTAGLNGCGESTPFSSPPGDTKPGKPLDELVSPDKLYKWEGEGAAKRKVELSREERHQLRQEAEKKAN